MCVQDVRSESGMWCSTKGSMVLAVSWTPPFWSQAVYNDYVITYPNSPFHEDTLKDQLWNALRDLKIDTSNGEGTKKVVLQSYEVLAQFKATNSHATKNMFKQIKDFIVGRPSTTVVSPNSPNSTEAYCPSPTLRPTIPPNSSKRPFDKQKTKQEML
jgi:hypothetical protein